MAELSYNGHTFSPEDLARFAGIQDAPAADAGPAMMDGAMMSAPAASEPAAYHGHQFTDDELLRLAGGAPSTQTPSAPVEMLPGLAAAAARGLTVGLSDPIRGAEYATGQALQGSSFPGAAWLGRQITPPWSPDGPGTGTWAGDYQKSVGAAKRSEDQFASDHPILAPLAYGAGTALTLPFTAAMGLGATAARGFWQAAGQGAKVGAEFGGAGGLADALMNPTESYWDQAKRAAAGTAAGTLTGGALAGATHVVAPYAQNVLSRFLPDSYGKNLAADRASALLNADKVGQPEVDAMAGGHDLAVMDVGGVNTRGAAGKIYREPGEPGAEIDKFLVNRDAGVGERGAYDPFTVGGASDRAVAITKQALGTDDPLLTEQAILAKQKVAADPLYEAFRGEAPLEKTKLDPFMSSPSFRTAVARANRDALDNGEPPLTEFFDFNAAGDPIAVKDAAVPPAVLDKVKQGLDDNWLAAKASGDPGNARTANNLRTRFVSFMDDAYPNTYPQARAAYSGPATSLDALKQGAETFKMAPDQIAQRLSELAPEDQRLFQLGGQKALVSRVLNTQDGANEVKKILGTPAMRNQVKALFTDPAQLDQFANAMGAENRKFSTLKDITRGSQTAGRTAWDKQESPAADILGGLAQGAVATLAGEPAAGGMGIVHALRKAAAPLLQPSEASNMALARTLMSTDPETLARLLGTPRQGSAPTLAGVLAGQAGRAAAPAPHWLFDQ